MHLKLHKKSNSKATEETGDLNDIKIINKITKNLPQNNLDASPQTGKKSIETPKERCISPEKK